MPTWYGSTWGLAAWGLLPIHCHVSSQTALLPLGRPDRVLDAVAGHLPFHVAIMQPCWKRPRGLLEEAGLLPRAPPWSLVHLTGGCFWGAAAPATLVSMHKGTPLCLRSCPFPLAGAGGPQTHFQMPRFYFWFHQHNRKKEKKKKKQGKNQTQPSIAVFPAVCMQGEAVECHV